MNWEKIGKHVLFWGFTLFCVSALFAYLYPINQKTFTRYVPQEKRTKDIYSVAQSLDLLYEKNWKDADLEPAPIVDNLMIARRLSLALTGSIPSYEEIAKLEQREKIENPREFSQYWLSGLLDNREDPRFADYFAERFARAYVGNEDGAFIIFRRRRFRVWLAEQFSNYRIDYGRIVEQMIASDGIWTETPSVNFITSSVKGGTGSNQPDQDILAGKVSRAFLGMRLDCAQCHDHPFEKWTQDDYRGLAAYFGQTENGAGGISENYGKEYEVEDRETLKKIKVNPEVPFLPELVDTEENHHRWRLARWVTHKKNISFARATVNRVWALMFGRGLVDPVDDMSSVTEYPPALELLSKDFADNDYDIKRLIRIIAATKVYHVDSAADFELTDAHEANWACFPMTRLRPEQAIGSLIQATDLQTNDHEDHIFSQLIRYGQSNEFVKRYGDAGRDELLERGGTIPQRLLLMNGNMATEKLQSEGLSFIQQTSSLVSDDETAISVAYLSTLSRKPTKPELIHFLAAFDGKKNKARVREMENLYWALINSSEFSWNH